MKLRLRRNSVRFRLLQSEVRSLSAAAVVTEEVRFGAGIDQALKYSVGVSGGTHQVTVRFSDNQILVLLPETVAMEWALGDTIAIESVIEIDETSSLQVLIEKDFVCPGREDDPDNTDAFPNPKADCG